MVTHSSTSRPVQCLCMAERTGCPVFTDLWSYVLKICFKKFIKYNQKVMTKLNPRASNDENTTESTIRDSTATPSIELQLLSWTIVLTRGSRR
jgi:hypothetical protein